MASELNKNLITFIYRFEIYKYKIMPFRLCGVLRSFQQFINNNFNKFQKSILYYINDLLIFLKIKKEYIKHVLIILKRLKKIKLNINILKLKFYI